MCVAFGNYVYFCELNNVVRLLCCLVWVVIVVFNICLLVYSDRWWCVWVIVVYISFCVIIGVCWFGKINVVWLNFDFCDLCIVIVYVVLCFGKWFGCIDLILLFGIVN